MKKLQRRILIAPKNLRSSRRQAQNNYNFGFVSLLSHIGSKYYSEWLEPTIKNADGMFFSKSKYD